MAEAVNTNKNANEKIVRLTQYVTKKVDGIEQRIPIGGDIDETNDIIEEYASELTPEDYEGVPDIEEVPVRRNKMGSQIDNVIHNNKSSILSKLIVDVVEKPEVQAKLIDRWYNDDSYVQAMGKMINKNFPDYTVEEIEDRIKNLYRL